MENKKNSSEKVTIKTVAMRSGTSIATVSRVIHGNYPVSEQLRTKINKVIKETGYRTNAAAASIRTRKTNTVGMIVSRFNNPLVMQMVQGVESVLNKEGYQLIISSTNNDLEREIQILHSFEERRVDAVVAASVSQTTTPFEPFLAANTPIVIIDRSISGTQLDMVINDDRTATATLTEYVLKRGHKRIALLKGPDSIIIGRERTQGVIDALDSYGIEENQRFFLEGDFSREIAHDAVLELINNKGKEELPTAIVACNTLMAEGAMQALYESGMKIPHDISLVCYGVISRSPVFRPRIVCMDQRSEELGIAAGTLVLDRLHGDTRSVTTTVIPANFITGDSVRKIS
jgi:LacI family transcriptional regulator